MRSGYRSAVLLLSGGLDSTALAYWRRPRVAVTVDYGQAAARAEIATASRVARRLGMPHHIVQMNLAEFGSGILAGKPQPLKTTSPEWWPFRNQLLVTIGAMAAIRTECAEVWIGTVAVDRRRHRDGTPRFVHLLSNVLQLQEGSIRLVAPALRLNSVTLLKRANVPSDVLTWCHSCHTGPLACGTCPGCVKSEEIRRSLLTNRAKARGR
jgi:7-cyano-7-deazaguanine synthase